MSDDLLRPPQHPFYARRAPGKRPRRFRNQKQEYYDRKARELAEELAKPQGERVGRLKTMKSGDFSEEEIEAVKARYKIK